MELTMAVIADNLPEMCAARNPASKSPIIIKRGESGYFPAPENMDVKGFNRRLNVTGAQVEAMIAGSMFGWSVPGADPANCDGRTAAEYV
jgi:hypothetical protein